MRGIKGDVKASITSTFGHMLKLDSTKKTIVKKLAGQTRNTAAWHTNVGNKHGQVVMSVVTVREGEELPTVADGLEQRKVPRTTAQRPQSNDPVLSRVREGQYERKQGKPAEDPAQCSTRPDWLSCGREGTLETEPNCWGTMCYSSATSCVL
ncbi:hypothetical protein ACOMHN_049192 [Nucella lapillus]